jgi:hypothetical protein
MMVKPTLRGIPFPLFGSLLLVKGRLGLLFGLVGNHAALAGMSDPSPLAHEAVISKQIGLDVEVIVPLHVPGLIDTVKGDALHEMKAPSVCLTDFASH